MNLVLPYGSRLWQVGDYPSDNTIWAVTQTPDGFIWLGTQGGLGRLIDGEFEWVPAKNDDYIGSERIPALCLDHEAGIWVWGGMAGLARYKDGKTTHYTLPKGISPAVLSLLTASDGSIWLGTATGLARYQDGKFSAVNIGSSSNGIRSLFEDAQQQVWAGADDQLIVLREGRVLTNYNLKIFRPGFVRSIHGDRAGNIWIGSNTGLLRLKEGKFIQYTKANSLPDNTVTAIYEDRHGTLWVGTYGGLCRLVNERLVVELDSRNEPFGQILCFFEDRENNLWVGAQDGLHQLKVQPLTTFTTRQGLSHNSVTSVAEDSAGDLWIGTWGGGLNHLHDGKISVYSSANTPVLWSDLVLATCPARAGGLWFGLDNDGGLYRLKNGVMQHWGTDEGLARSAVRVLLEDRAGRLLVGQAQGRLRILENEKFVADKILERPEFEGIRCLLEARDGRIWMGGDRGVTCWSNQNLTTFTDKDGLPNTTILALLEDREQTLWIGTLYGLVHFKNGKFTTYRTEQRFYEDYAMLEILEDDGGNIWLATRRGVVRLSRKEIDDFETGQLKKVTWTTLGKGEGMNRVICVGHAKPAAWKSRDGRMWFTTTKGLTLLDPAVEIKTNAVPPTVVIRSVSVDKKPITVSLWGRETLPGWGSTPIQVEPGHTELEFRFTGLSYVAPEKNQYRYKLEGLDSNWVEAGHRRQAFYNNVPPGNYTFRVIAANSDSVWSSLGANVKLTLRPHYWQTKWFSTLMALVMVGVVASAARMVAIRKMRRELEKHEQQRAIEKERSRIAQDLHDQLGAGLTQVGLLGELARRQAEKPEQTQRHAENITQLSRELAQTVDEIVWSVDPQNDTLNHLASYIAVYAEDFFHAAGLACRLDIPPGLPPIPLSAEFRHHLFSVVKEALNNLAKYARASEATLRLTLGAAELEMEIADNGQGFSRGQVASGHGLANMETRIQALGGRFALHSEPGKGTRIVFTVPRPR